MINKAKILEIVRKTGKISTIEISKQFGVSRQYIAFLLRQLVELNELVKIGSTRNAFYVAPEYIKEHPMLIPSRFFKRLNNQNLEEHKVLSEIEAKFPQIKALNEHARAIFDFAFSEMLNNAIEHSQSKIITIEVSAKGDDLWFIVSDSGIGAFRNIMKKKKLNSELEAIQDLLKGKTTTIPHSHSGQGIFFTSKAADIFILDSFGQQLTVNNKNNNVSISRPGVSKRGTRVIFRIKGDSRRHLSSIFKEYTNLSDESDYGFDKTDISVKLYTQNGVNISRSQARRILHGLEKFKIVQFDYAKVPMIGQAFADEIYRVFHNRHPDIMLKNVNMNDTVSFMIERAKTDAKQSDIM